MSDKLNRYKRLIEAIFFAYYQPGMQQFEFPREDLERHAKKLKIALPKNLGDIIYTFRYRVDLPARVLATATDKKSWIISPAGRGVYRFELTTQAEILPNPQLLVTKIPDATPGLVDRYRLGDEQALLAKLRYNRMLDIFTGVTCYSLQNHLRTQIPNVGQIETDELYIGVDRHGAHYIFPVQAKGGKDRLNVVQIRQDLAMCGERFPDLICRAIGAQFLAKDQLALFEFAMQTGEVRIASERHYQLVPQDKLESAELAVYRTLAERDE